MENEKEVFVNTEEDEKELKEIVNRLDKKMKEAINDPELPEKCRQYQEKYGNIPEENKIKRFTI